LSAGNLDFGQHHWVTWYWLCWAKDPTSYSSLKYRT